MKSKFDSLIDVCIQAVNLDAAGNTDEANRIMNEWLRQNEPHRLDQKIKELKAANPS